MPMNVWGAKALRPLGGVPGPALNGGWALRPCGAGQGSTPATPGIEGPAGLSMAARSTRSNSELNWPVTARP